jgi:hypothetical protein
MQSKKLHKTKKNLQSKKTQYVLKFQIIKSDLKTFNLKLYFKHQLIWIMFTLESISK